MRMRFLFVAIILLSVSACAGPRMKLFPDATDPLREFTLQGKEKGKVLAISVQGIISDSPKDSLFGPKPSMVQEIVSQLKLAEKDEEVRAILLVVDSPGGSTTASDILYHEIMGFKKRTGARVVAAMMGMATSGGYYVSLPADFILAQPTTVTGSIGVVFVRPELTGLMGKIGLDIDVKKSGRNKDMASPFRKPTEEEERIMQSLIDQLGARFLRLVSDHRHVSQDVSGDVSSARVYLADEALERGLIDQIGYVDDAIAQAKKLAGLPGDAKVVVYRRSEYPDDNIYNTSVNKYGGARLSLIDLGMLQQTASLSPGFYYIWMPAADRD